MSETPPCFVLAIGLALGGCYQSHEIDDAALGDGGRDAGPLDSGCSADAVPGGCCSYGMPACRSAADCTDPSRPYCVPLFASSTCASSAGCGFLCASPDTPIATPDGERAIVDVSLGTMVYSVDRGAVRPVPVIRLARNAVRGHAVVHVGLASGRTLEMSPGHPTADGRTFADLAPGGTLGGASIVEVETIPYEHDATYDILPASDTGTYFAAGVLVGSTLAGRGDTPGLAAAQPE